MTQKQLLQNLGLGRISTAIYLYLIKNGANTVLNISRNTGISRTNVYHHIAKLKELSLVSDGVIGHKKNIIPESPNNLVNIVKAKIDLVEEAANILSSKFMRNKNNANIKFFYGSIGFQQCLDDILNSGHKEIFQIANYEAFHNFTSQSNIKKFETKRIGNNISLKILLPHDNKSKIFQKYSEIECIKELREISFMPSQIIFDMSIIINSSVVYIFTSLEEGSILRIDNSSIAASLLSLFLIIQKISEPFKNIIVSSNKKPSIQEGFY